MKNAKSKTIRPLGNRVVLTKIANPDQSPGGIILPETAKQKPIRGRVVAKGPGEPDIDAHGSTAVLTTIESIDVGDEVLYPQYAGNEVEIDGTTYLIVSAGDLLGVVE